MDTKVGTDVTSQIVVETLVGLILGILGASLNAPPLKEITWASEMQKQYALYLYKFMSSLDMRTARSTKWIPVWDSQVL
jgi:hypothetical protein